MLPLVLACAPPDEVAALPPNLLVVVLDDVGVDEVSVYGSPDAAETPVIDALAARGMRFDHAWASPTCSPSRASLLTGRHPLRHTIGAVLDADVDHELPLAEITLAEALATADPPYTSAAVGKWHLSTLESDHATEHPLLQGFDAFAGTLDNIVGRGVDGEEQSMVDWERVGFDGETRRSREFTTDVEADDAIDLVPALREPWFLYLAFHAPHEPRRPPPGSAVDEDDPEALFRANVTYVDAALGRVLASLGDDDLERTLVVVVGDNGTPELGGDVGLPGSKGSLAEGGVRVPFVVAGAGVPQPGVSRSLVHLVDVFPTLLEVAGAPTPPAVVDGRSLVPLLADPTRTVRRIAYTELRRPAEGPPWTSVLRSASDGRWKLVDVDGELHAWAVAPDGRQLQLDALPPDRFDALAEELRRFPP